MNILIQQYVQGIKNHHQVEYVPRIQNWIDIQQLVQFPYYQMKEEMLFEPLFYSKRALEKILHSFNA